jgi:hypothetical protein
MQITRSYSKLAIAGLVVYTACLVAAMTLFITKQLSEADAEQAGRAGTDAATQAQRYAGTVVIPDAASGRCRHLQFDNNTGSLRERNQSRCVDEVPAENSTQGRINAIRDAFAKH